MESWKNGREEIFELLTKICNQTGENIRAEVNDPNVVRINREELRLLKENSAANSKLNGQYGRLQDELEEARARASRVEELEKENRRLAGELEQSLQKPAVTTPAPPIVETKSRATLSSSGPPSSFSKRIELDGIKYVRWEDYQLQIKKYNDMSQSYLDAKDAKDQIEWALREEREKAKQWASNDAEMKKALEKRRDKIQRLVEEIKSLKNNLPADKIALEDAGGVIWERAPQGSREAPRSPRIEVLERTSHDRPSSQHLPKSNGTSVDKTKVDISSLQQNHDSDVEDTEFEPIEQHHSESTETGSDTILHDQHTPINPQTKNYQQPATNRSLGRGFAERSPSPETPVVISSRSVKKRKLRHETTGPYPITKVKTEEIGSSPVGLAAFHYLNPNESIDLDDIGDKVDTPRKHRQLELTGQSSQPQSSPSHFQSRSQGYYGTSQTSPPLSNTPAAHTSTVLQPRSVNHSILPRTSDDKAPKRQRVASDQGVTDLVEDGEILWHEERQPIAKLIIKSKPRKAGDICRDPLVAISKPVLRRADDFNTRLGNLLENPSPQRRVLSPNSNARGSTDQARLGTVLATPSLAHEFEYTPSGLVSRGSARSFKNHAGSTFKGMLGSSANSGRLSLNSSSKTSAEPTQLPPTSPRRRTTVASPLFATPGPTATKPSTSKKRSPAAVKDDATLLIDPSEQPLRVRPLQRLNINDFKINPDYNQGYDYAFNEVVRGGTARACLSGCTKPECCGKGFRALAEMARNTGRQPTMSQEEADEMLLDEFMGDNAYKIRNMTKAEKEEMMIQAKTRELSNKHGRHRMAYERRASPPGFWRADFPTTQEDLADKERSRAKERDVVAERYQQAMRPGGAYIFRDE